jgi:hypothetical protein
MLRLIPAQKPMSWIPQWIKVMKTCQFKISWCLGVKTVFWLLCFFLFPNAEAELSPFVNSNGLWGYEQEDKTVRIKPQFTGAKQFSEGLAPVSVTPTNVLSVKRQDGGITAHKQIWGYIDEKGIFVIQPCYASASIFNNGYAKVEAVGDMNVNLVFYCENGERKTFFEPNPPPTIYINHNGQMGIIVENNWRPLECDSKGDEQGLEERRDDVPVFN